MRAFAASAALLMILTAFTGLSPRAAASGDGTSLPSAVEADGTVYGPGIALTPLPDGNTRVRHLPTFQRWDGVWRPVSAMDRSAGEWPYLVEETATEIRVTRLGHTFTQAKVPGALYEYMPLAIKETLVLSTIPSNPVVIPLTASLAADVAGLGVVLRDGAGREAWATDAFRAWDSSDPPRTWDSPVASLSYADGRLRIGLDSAMLAAATYPLYVDPTWILNATTGWVGSEFQDATEDMGDHSVKIGWFADNFDDNANERWTTVSGPAPTFANGVMTMNVGTHVRAGGPWWDLTFKAELLFASSFGTIRMYFRYQDELNRYYLEVSERFDQLALAKVIGGTTTTLWSTARTIATNTPYVVKVSAQGDSFTIMWDGAVLFSGSDPSPPWPPMIGDVGFEEFGPRRSVPVDVDDVRVWNTDIGSITTPVRDAGAYRPNRMRTVHTGSAYDWVDLQILFSSDGVNWSDPRYVKAGAKSKASDGDAYFIPDPEFELGWPPIYRARVDLRTTQDGTPALSEVAVIEETKTSPRERSQLLGYEPWQYYVGGMVNVVSGNLLVRSTDLTLPGKGWSLAFGRAYNSLSSASGPLGVGWTHTYNVYLTPGTGTVTFTDGDGSAHVFEDLGGGLYASPRGLGGVKLLRNGDGTYTMSWKDGSKWSFSSAGTLAEMADRNGNRVTLTYDANGRLAKVADDSGVSLAFGYDMSGRLIRVGDHNATTQLRKFGAHSGSWAHGLYAWTSDDQYATSSTGNALHTFYAYGFTGPASDWIMKVEACVEAYTAGDDDLGVKVSTDGGTSWSAEQVVDLPSADPNALTCLDFTSHEPVWSWSHLSNANFRVQVRYAKVGQASQNRLDWIPVRVTTAGRFWSYVYDGSGRLAMATDPLQKSELFTYAGTLERFVDRADRVLRFVKDASSRVTGIWTGQYDRGTGGTLWEFRQYDISYPVGLAYPVTDVWDALGNRTRISFDTLAGRPVDIDGPLAASPGGSERWTMAWDGEHNLLSRTDGRGNTNRFAYDWRGNLVGDVDASGNVTTSIWRNRDDGTVFDSLLLQNLNRRGFPTTYEYDWRGNPVTTTDALGNVTRTFYTPEGFVNKTTDKRGFNTTYAYDGHGWLLNSTDPLGNTVRYGYDAVGRLVSVTSALNLTTRRAYNANDWLVAETNPLGHTTRYEYNARGDRTAIVDANGNQTTYVVNITWGQVQKEIGPTNDTTENMYDRLGRLIQMMDPNGQVWRYEYDRFGRQTNVTDALGNVTRYSFDAAGNVISKVDGNGKYTNFTLYDALNRLKRVEHQDGTVFTYGYDANGNVVTETGYGFTRTTDYDALDRVKSVTFDFGPFSKTVQYTYDAADNRKTIVYPGGLTLTYVWDTANWLVNISAPGQTWSFLYDKDGRLTTVRHPNGLEMKMTYDNASRVRTLRSRNPSTGALLEGYAFAYDRVGNRLAVLQELNGTTVSYDYTRDYALNRTFYAETSTHELTYSYDANRNRILKLAASAVVENWTHAYNDDSSVRQVVYRFKNFATGMSGGYTDNYLYDKNGNLIQRERVNQGPFFTVGYINYGYDLENRLVRIHDGNSDIATYAYFTDGARIRKTVDGTTTYYLYDPWDFSGFNDVIEEYNATGGLLARYVHGPGVDQPLAMERGGAWYYYHVDSLGSVTMLTDSAGNVVNRYVYDDFGNFRAKWENVTNPYTYTGREADVLGVLYYRARYYDPSIGRFLTRDPAGMVDGTNQYEYAGGNPVNWVDASGERHDRGRGKSQDKGRGQGRGRGGGPQGAGSNCVLEWTIFAVGLALGLVGFGVAASKVRSIAGSLVRGIVGGAAAGAALAVSIGNLMRNGLTIGSLGDIINIAWIVIQQFILPTLDWLAVISFVGQAAARLAPWTAAITFGVLLVSAIFGAMQLRNMGC